MESRPQRSDFHEGPFETIELVTDLASDVECLVAYANLPPFRIYPKAVMWGQRIFQLKSEGTIAKRAVYAEVFAVAVVSWKSKLNQIATPSGGVEAP